MTMKYFKNILLLILWAALAVRVYHGSTPALVTALAWCAALGFFYWNLERSGKPDRARAFYFFSLALFFLLGLHLGGFEAATGKSIQPYCHLSLAGNVLSIGAQQAQAFLGGNYGRYGFLGLGLLWLLVLLVCGGGFCSRVCFFGGWDDAFSRVRKKPVLRVLDSLGGTRVREFQLALFLFLAFMTYSQGVSEFCLWVCPFKRPVGEVLDPSSRVYVAQLVAYGVIAVLFVVILPILTRKRTFCSTLCPFGALPPLIQKWMPYQVKIDPDTCTACRVCETECPSFAIETVKRPSAQDGKPLEAGALKRKDIYETRITRYCTLCMRCVPSCPSGGIKAFTGGQKGSGWLDFISLGFGGALSLFYVPQAVLAVVAVIKMVI